MKTDTQTFDCYLDKLKVRVRATFELLKPDPVYFAEVYIHNVDVNGVDVLKFLSEEAQESLVSQIMEELDDRYNKSS